VTCSSRKYARLLTQFLQAAQHRFRHHRSYTTRLLLTVSSVQVSQVRK
jgi:Predicted dehydrogenases and related proteins